MDQAKRRKLRLRPTSVCPLCDGLMERKTTIAEKTGYRHWGDVDPFLKLGGIEIHHFICIACGNVAAYQVQFQFDGFGETKEERRRRRREAIAKKALEGLD